ncbi:MAG: DUF2492 family protein [Holophaga sp.]|nr:DUF2492 family protein [Holophaga sp.]
MSDAIHGREMYELVASRVEGWSLVDLQAEAESRWGKQSDFCNCHGDQFSFDTLIPFLAQKGKVRVEADRIFAGEPPHQH